jgi:hypothetical protein
MANVISTLINAGHDAFANLYDVKISLPNKLATGTIAGLVDTTFQQGNTAQTKILTRVGNFQPPESSLGEYQTYYQSGSITRQNAKIALTRTITIPFRIDDSYDLYKILKAWQGLYLGPNQADYRLPKPIEDADYFGLIEVDGYKSTMSTTDPVTGELITSAKWVFDKVMCTDVAEPQFGRDAANPVEVSATFLYYYLNPPTSFVV